MERKRVHYNSSLKAGTGATTDLVATIDETNGVNAHNIHFSITIEADSTDANSKGQWVLWCIPDENSAVPSSSQAALEAEGSNAFLWACGLWAGSNQTPYNSGDIYLKTTRNCQRGARLVLGTHVEGVTAGSNRIDKMLTYNTKSL